MRLRINLGMTGQDSRVFLVAPDGTEHDFSNLVRRVRVAVGAGEITTLVLEMYVPDCEINLDNPAIYQVRVRDNEIVAAAVAITSLSDLTALLQKADDDSRAVPAAEIESQQ